MRSLLNTISLSVILFSVASDYCYHKGVEASNTCTVTNTLSTTLPTSTLSTAGITNFVLNSAGTKMYYTHPDGAQIRSVDYPAMTNDAALAGDTDQTGNYQGGTGTAIKFWKPKPMLMDSNGVNTLYGSTSAGGGLAFSIATEGATVGTIDLIAGQNNNAGGADGNLGTNTVALWSGMTWFSSTDENRMVVTQRSMIRILDLRGSKMLTTLVGNLDNSAITAGFGLNARLRFMTSIVSYRGGAKFYSVSVVMKVFVAYDWDTTLLSVINTQGGATTVNDDLSAGQSLALSGTYDMRSPINGILGSDCIWYLVSSYSPGAIFGVDVENDWLYMVYKDTLPILDIKAVPTTGSADTPTLLVRIGTDNSGSTNGLFKSGVVTKHASCPTDRQCGLTASRSATISLVPPPPPTPMPPTPQPPTPAPTPVPETPVPETPVPPTTTTTTTTTTTVAPTPTTTSVTTTTEALTTTTTTEVVTTTTTTEAAEITTTTTTSDPNLVANANASPQAPASSSSVSTGALIGIIVGAIVLVIIVVGVLVYVLVIAKKSETNTKEDPHTSEAPREVMASVVPGEGGDNLQESSIFNNENVSPSNPLGSSGKLPPSTSDTDAVAEKDV